MKVGVAVLGSMSWDPCPYYSPYGLCGRKATFTSNSSELRSCVKVEVDVLGSPSLTALTVSVELSERQRTQQLGLRGVCVV